MNTGAFGENFPYSNFHDLNMDWIIKIAKNFLDQYTHIQETIEDGEIRLTNLTEEELGQLTNKAEELEALLQAWYNTHSSDIANQLATAIADFDQSADDKARRTIASIPDDYTALTNEVTVNKNSIEHINDSISITTGGPVMYDWEWIADEYVITENGEFGHYNGWHRSGYVPLNGAKAIRIETNASSSFRNNAFYDENKDYIDEFNISNPLIIVPSNARYFAVSQDNDTVLNVYNADALTFSDFVKMGLYNNLHKTKIIDTVESFYANYSASQTSVYRKIKDLTLTQNKTYTLSIDYFTDSVNDTLVIIYFYDGSNNVVGKYEITKTQPIITFTTPRSFSSCDMWAIPVGATPASSAGIAVYKGITITEGNNTLLKNYIGNYTELPNYFDYTMSVKKDTVITRLPENGDCMVVITDYHTNYNANHSPSIINWISENTPVDKVFNLGDTVNVASDVDTMITELSRFRKLFSTRKYFATCGNHEWYTNLSTPSNPIPTEGQLYNTLVKENENIVKGRSSNCSYYFDNELQKIRYIVLGCNYNSDLNVEQVNWCTGVIANTPTDYTIAVFSHTGLTYNDSIPIGSFSNITTALENFGGKVAGVFTGHQHKEAQYVSPGGVHFIGLSCDSYAQQEGDMTRALGTYTEQCFYIIQINTTANTTYIENIGAGTSTYYNY